MTTSAARMRDEDVDDAEFAPLAEEGNDDISLIISSIDLDPDDPTSAETLKRMAHRQEGPLREFSARRAQYLRRTSKQPIPGVQKMKRSRLASLESALMDVQVKASGQVITHVRERQREIQQGLRDPKQERLQADPKYVERAREIAGRIERWVEQQKDNPNKKGGLLKELPANLTDAAAAKVSAIEGAPTSATLQKITIEGARVPLDVARGNAIAKATYFASNAVKGFSCTMYLRRFMEGHARNVFVSRDLTRIIARRIGGDESEEVLKVADVTNILLGHKTDVFRDMRVTSRHPNEGRKCVLVSYNSWQHIRFRVR